jgi:penicillin-binding protein A
LLAFTEQKAGFNQHLSLIAPELVSKKEADLASEPSSIIASSARQKTGKPLGETGIGQWDVHMTPLHMALWTGAIANGGKMLAPQLVTQITDTNKHELWKDKPLSLGAAMAPEAIKQTAALMRSVVASSEGSAHKAFKGCRIAVAGKTGTADKDNKTKNALFIGFAPYNKPKIAVAVILENVVGAETGGKVAAPLARRVIEATLSNP